MLKDSLRRNALGQLEVVVEAVPDWAIWVARAVDWLDYASGHRWCGAPVWVPSPIAHRLHQLFDFLFFLDVRHARVVSRSVSSLDVLRVVADRWPARSAD